MNLPDRPTAQDIEDWAMGFEDARYGCSFIDSDTTEAKNLLAEYRKQAQFIADCMRKARRATVETKDEISSLEAEVKKWKESHERLQSILLRTAKERDKAVEKVSNLEEDNDCLFSNTARKFVALEKERDEACDKYDKLKAELSSYADEIFEKC